MVYYYGLILFIFRFNYLEYFLSYYLDTYFNFYSLKIAFSPSYMISSDYIRLLIIFINTPNQPTNILRWLDYDLLLLCLSLLLLLMELTVMYL
jgi:hypothetical protein